MGATPDFDLYPFNPTKAKADVGRRRLPERFEAQDAVPARVDNLF
jgi:hypothetical protein